MSRRIIASLAAASLVVLTLFQPVYAAEYIANGDISQIGPNGDPVGWNRGGYGDNFRVHDVRTVDGVKYLFALVRRDNDGGNVKWYFQDVPVTPGQQLVLAYKFRADDPNSKVTLRYRIGDTYKYETLNTIYQFIDPTFYPYRRTFTVPAGATSMTAWHSATANPDEQTSVYSRDWSLTDAVPFAPVKGENLIRNADLAELVASGQTAYWSRSGNVNRSTCGSCTAGYFGYVALGFRGTSTIRAAVGSQLANLAAGTGRKLELTHSGMGSYGGQLELRLSDGSKKWLNSFSMATGSSTITDTRSFVIPDNATGVRLWFFQDNSPTAAYVHGFSLIQK